MSCMLPDGTRETLIAYPIVWLIVLPFRLLGIAVGGVLELIRTLITLPTLLVQRSART